MAFNEWLMADEKPVRIGLFFGMLAVMAQWEVMTPCPHRLQGGEFS
jgi:hypothetical protein